MRLLVLATILAIGSGGVLGCTPDGTAPESQSAASAEGGKTTDLQEAKGARMATRPPGVPPEPGRSPERTPESRAAADAMWTRFQSALRASDRDAVASLVADTLNAVRAPVARGTDGWAGIIGGLLNNGPVRDGLLALDGLEHNRAGSAAVVHVAAPDADSDALVYLYGFGEVAPGEWRLVDVRTRYSP